MLTANEKRIKRVFDVSFAIICLFVLGWLVLFMSIVSKVWIKGNGFFRQKRVGQYGNLFTIYKIETIHPKEAKKENPKITRLGKFLRKYKLDELPQLWNVLVGTMSFVGPRPDFQIFLDKLNDNEKIILSVKPGITGPATLHFQNEEELLKNQEKPKIYNEEVIWPQKVKMNIDYINEYCFINDIYYIFKTFI